MTTFYVVWPQEEEVLSLEAYAHTKSHIVNVPNVPSGANSSMDPLGGEVYWQLRLLDFLTFWIWYQLHQ